MFFVSQDDIESENGGVAVALGEIFTMSELAELFETEPIHHLSGIWVADKYEAASISTDIILAVCPD
jgi:hypothetical protein